MQGTSYGVARATLITVVLLTGAWGQVARADSTNPALLSLRAAVQHLCTTFGDAYPRGPEFLDRIAELDHALQQAAAGQQSRLEEELKSLQRDALLANPLVRSHPILFVVRRQYRSDHHNTATMFQTGEINTGSFHGGGAMKTIDFSRGGEVKTLLEVPDGVARDPDVSFDGKKGPVLDAATRPGRLPPLRDERRRQRACGS